MPPSTLKPPHPDFRSVELPSPFIRLSAGPIFERSVEGEFHLGLWTTERHSNAHGQVHGGFIISMADISLGLAIQRRDPDVRTTPTIHLDADFIDPATVGGWLEFRVEITRIGRSLGFATGTALADDRAVTRISGVFQLRRAPRHDV